MRWVVVVVLMEWALIRYTVVQVPLPLLDRPAGGSSSAFGDQDRFTSGDPALSLTKM